MPAETPDQKLMARASQSDHSPCVGHCTYDDDYFCLSCRRHTDEISAWQDGDNALRIAAWARIPGEIDKAGVDVMRLPLNPEDIADVAMDRLGKNGSWGVGAGNIWTYAHDLTSDADGVLKAVSRDGATTITLDLSGKMRALAWSREGAGGKRRLADGIDDLPILIVVPSARMKDAPLTTATVLDDGRTDLGFGFPSFRMLTDGEYLVIETLLATACIKGGKTPAGITSVLPQGLNLPESYVLAAVILPQGEVPL
jgi:predicted Fe-S protein YdhL (DUF1289 family)